MKNHSNAFHYICFRMNDTFFFIGFMGAGKSVIGKKMADELGYCFLDLDDELEKETGMSVNTLFEKYGESGFRKLETDWLNKIDVKKTIVALGGGTPCYNNNLKLIRKKGKSVYLLVNLKKLASRLISDPDSRPLIQDYRNNQSDLEAFISKKLKEREPFYKRANYIVSADAELEKVINQLKKIFE